MHVKSVVIDGFKSYAQKTIIDGFDREFNAITGLNGSGKSNILDSICFVLGITNLTQVRAAQLQDLVYKSGQAGVTKASVSIVFDNRDKTSSPMGYNQCDEITVTRQIVIGGRNKYLVNGINCTNLKVADMFRSVQLNVNNPHFLIMQGRITKVLNMKPPEILGMIEEAAGTKMYEVKKQNALKTIEKKDARLAEINTLLQDEINPQVERLKKDRVQYQRYIKLQSEVANLERVNIAYHYVKEKKAYDESEKNAETFVADREKFSNLIEDNRKKIEALSEEILQLQRKRDEQSGNKLEVLETELKKLQNEQMQAASRVDSDKDSLKTEQKKLQQTKKSVESDKKGLGKKERELGEKERSLGGVEAEGERDREELEGAERALEAAQRGETIGEDGKAATTESHLIRAKEELSEIETGEKKADAQLKTFRPLLKKKEQEMKTNTSEYDSAKRSIAGKEKEIETLQAQLGALNFEEGSDERMKAEARQLQIDVNRLREQKDNVENRFYQLQFEYDNPEPNWDRRKVKGLVARLIRLENPGYATALEVTAGGSLYHVIVDTDETGKKILNNGNLKKRVTIIPLNKISGRSINKDVITRAKNLVGKENCHHALSLVGYDRELQTAMEYVFGNTLVVNNMDQAKLVAYDRNVMKTTVTLQGECFKPDGVISGGSRPRNQGSVLQELNQLNDALTELKEKEAELREMKGRLQRVIDQGKIFAGRNGELQGALAEKRTMQETLQGNSTHQALEEIEQFKREIAENEEILRDAKEKKKELGKRIAELESQKKNAKKTREDATKKAEQRRNEIKKKIEGKEKNYKETKELLETLRLEMKQLEDSIAEGEGNVKASEEKIQELKVKIETGTAQVAEAKVSVDEWEKKIDQYKALLKQRNREIQTKEEERDRLSTEIQQSELKIQSLEHDMQKAEKLKDEAAKNVRRLHKDYPWIEDEEQHFGKAGTAFDFGMLKKGGLEARKEELEHLKRTVNLKAMTSLQEAEKKAEELIRNKEKLNNDRVTLLDSIKNLDAKKEEMIKAAHKEVNKDFGDIFTTLLPGTQAKLEPPKELPKGSKDKGRKPTVLDGLEVRVAFGDVWKESLAELSGGQRSLVALSLVLAMLKFKPAPIYILDEVDAALDLSHTQNIGSMIKRYFTASQFIVVSLKDGMFNNANVLFKTKFVDGCSTVTRHTQSHRPGQGSTQGDNRKRK